MADDNDPSDFELALNILESDFVGDAPPASGGSAKKEKEEMIKDTTAPPVGPAKPKVR
jgi:hypothetical protein